MRVSGDLPNQTIKIHGSKSACSTFSIPENIL